MVIFFVVIWKHVWRIIVYKVKEKKTRGGIQKKIKIILNHKEEYRNHQLRRPRLKIKKYKNKFAFFTPALSPLIRKQE